VTADELGFVHHYQPAERADAPTLLLLHGTGGDERDLVGLGRLLDPGAALLSPRGKVLEGDMPRWFRRHREGVFDIDDLIARTHELADFTLAAVDRYDLDTTSIIAVGFSNGANIASATLLLRPEILRAAVLLAPMVPLEPDDEVDLSGVGVFIGAGRVDPMAPPEQAEALAELLTERGAAVEVDWHAGGHGVDQSTVRAATVWLGKLRAAMAADPLP
jgi:predicted esterase